MKKSLVLAAVLAVFAVATAVAQPRAIGVRGTYGIGVNYQHNLGPNVLDIDLIFPGCASIGTCITYNWIDPFGATVPWNEKGSWDWYLGVGGKAGMSLVGLEYGAGGWVGVAGRVGIEYNFWFPLNISIDWTPGIGASFGKAMGQSYAGFNTGGLYMDAFALGIRYTF